jgi:ABC-type transport system involved in multi-copper enzyme maturation permease subunit
LAEERARGSLDVLMTTPMETAEIVIGKWLGTCRLVPPLAILPPLVVLGTAKPGIGWPMAIVTFVFILSAGASVASLGLAMATWCPRLGRAVGLTVSLYLLATVGWCCGVAAVIRTPAADRLMMGSPFFWPGAVTDSVSRVSKNGTWEAAILWTLVYALLALVLLAATLVTFNCERFVRARRSIRQMPRHTLGDGRVKPVGSNARRLRRMLVMALRQAPSYHVGCLVGAVSEGTGAAQLAPVL